MVMQAKLFLALLIGAGIFSMAFPFRDIKLRAWHDHRHWTSRNANGAKQSLWVYMAQAFSFTITIGRMDVHRRGLSSDRTRVDRLEKATLHQSKPMTRLIKVVHITVVRTLARTHIPYLIPLSWNCRSDRNMEPQTNWISFSIQHMLILCWVLLFHKAVATMDALCFFLSIVDSVCHCAVLCFFMIRYYYDWYLDG